MTVKTILVVESDQHQRLLYQMELEEDGYRVVTAAGLDKAAEKIEEESPDGIVLGIDLRNQGDPAVQGFLKRGWGIPVVVNTALGDCEGKAIRWLVDDCVIKSSNVEELKEKVRQALEKEFKTDIRFDQGV